MEWVEAHSNIALEVVPVLEQPEQIIRLEITHTPALVQEGELLAQSLTVDELVAYFARDWYGVTCNKPRRQNKEVTE